MSLVVDAHHHFVDPARVHYHFLEFLPSLDRFIGPKDLTPPLDSARDVLRSCSDAERDAIFGGNALRIYRLERAP